MDFPDTPEYVPTLLSYQTTAADNLGPEEITELHSRGIAPYATTEMDSLTAEYSTPYAKPKFYLNDRAATTTHSGPTAP